MRRPVLLRHVLAILLLGGGCGGGDPLPTADTAGGGPGAFEPQAERRAQVERVVDGETVVLAGGQRVRLLGVDAPQGGEACAAESREYVERLVGGREVVLDLCPAPSPGEPLVEGEVAAYVVVPGGSFVNVDVLRAGLGQYRGTAAACGGPAAEARLADGQAEAMDAGRGVFGRACASPPAAAPPVTAEPTPTPVVMEPPPPGSDAARASIRIVGLGNPPPEPPIRGDGLWVEAIVAEVSPVRVEFFIDSRPARTDRQWPYTLGDDRFDTRTVSDGYHTATARAVFPDGSVAVAHQPMWVEND